MHGRWHLRNNTPGCPPACTRARMRTHTQTLTHTHTRACRHTHACVCKQWSVSSLSFTVFRTHMSAKTILKLRPCVHFRGIGWLCGYFVGVGWGQVINIFSSKHTHLPTDAGYQKPRCRHTAGCAANCFPFQPRSSPVPFSRGMPGNACLSFPPPLSPAFHFSLQKRGHQAPLHSVKC